jgi:hypothetical protein
MEEQKGDGTEYKNRSFDGESNVIDRNAWQLIKLHTPMSSTEFAMEIDCSDVLSNAISAIAERFDSDSKVTVSRDLQREKHSLARNRTDDGMQIDFSDKQ